MMLEKLIQDYKNALKNKQENKKIILNYVLSQLKNKKIELQRELSDEEIVALLRKEIKALVEAMTYLKNAGKLQAFQDEQEKKNLLESYLPQLMNKEQTEILLKNLISRLGLSDLRKERGLLMKTIKSEYGSQVDLVLANELVNWML